MEVHYLDNSATTPVLPEAAQAAVELMTEEYGNPSSLHTKGFAARQRVEAARAAVAARLGARPEELTFTSGVNAASAEFETHNQIDRCPLCGIALNEKGVCPKCGYKKG